MVEVKRGEVWVARLSSAQRGKVGKTRPVLIIQDDLFIQENPETLIVLPLTSQIRSGIRHLRVRLPIRDRLLMESHVILEKPMTLDRRRFGEGPLAALTNDEMTAVERGLLAVMGMADYLPDL
ncbi:MAG: type II toxin-antitoxin system PemK/MazF family toxin [bacterium]